MLALVVWVVKSTSEQTLARPLWDSVNQPIPRKFPNKFQNSDFSGSLAWGFADCARTLCNLAVLMVLGKGVEAQPMILRFDTKKVLAAAVAGEPAFALAPSYPAAFRW